MLTSLEFLEKGQKWVPPQEAARLELIKRNKQLYEGSFHLAFKDVWEKITTRYGLSDKDIEQVMVLVNLFPVIVDVFMDFALGREPKFKAKKDEAKGELDAIVKRTKFNKDVNEKAFVDGFIFGNGVYKVSRINGEVVINVVTPDLWFPVVNPKDKNEFTHHVLAYKYSELKQSFLGGTSKAHLIKVEIHEKGKLAERTLKLDDSNNIIEVREDSEENFADEWDNFLVFPFNFGAASWQIFGNDQFSPIVSLIEELIVRLSDNSKILDYHASPQIMVPDTALDYDAYNNVKVYSKKDVIMVDKEDIKPEYLTWDGNINNSEVQITRVMDFIYMITGTNPQIFGKDLSGGNLSGQALRKIFMRPIAKTKRMQKNLGVVTEDVLKCALALTGIQDVEIDAEFFQPAFDSEDEVSTRAVDQKRGGISSARRSVKVINPEYDDEQVEKELLEINGDIESSNKIDFNLPVD